MVINCRHVTARQRGALIRRHIVLLAVVGLLTVLLSGCSVAGVQLTVGKSAGPTPVTTVGTSTQNIAAQATSQAQPTPAFDASAGNCPDAATQAIDLMSFTQQRNLTFDMQVALSPVKGCGSTNSAGISLFRNRVTTADLSAYVLDGTWSQAYTADRTALLDDLLARLHSLYPAATVTVNVYYNLASVASGQLGADNVPHVQCCSG